MEKKKTTSPATILVLGVGAVLAVSLATWTIKRTLAPPQAASGPAPMAGPGQPGVPGGTPGTGPIMARPAPSGEAGLALGADPFIQLPAPAPLSPVLARGSAPVLPAPGRPPIRTADWRVPASVIPPIIPITPASPGSVPTTLQGTPAAVPAAPPEPPPALVGTLTGERASAVFRSDNRMVVVPITGKFGNWQVISVDHGGAVLKNGSRTVRVFVGGDRVPGVAESRADPVGPGTTAPVPAAAPTPAPDPPRRRPTRKPMADAAPPAYGEPPAGQTDRPRLTALSPAAAPEPLGAHSASGSVAQVAPPLYGEPPDAPAPRPRLQALAPAPMSPEPVDPTPQRSGAIQEPGPVALAPEMSLPVAETEPDPGRPDEPPADRLADITED